MKLFSTLLILLFFVNISTAQYGLLDPNYGTAGIATVQGSYDIAHASVAVDNMDRVIVAGSINGNLHLARYNSSGQLDMSFGTNGIASINVGVSDAGMDVLVQPDQKIIVGGSTDTTINGNAIVVRLLSNGTLDNSFGTAGVFEYTGIATFDRVREMVYQNGDIVALLGIGSGSSSAPGANNYENIGLIKINTFGTFDASFATSNGLWQTTWLDIAWDRSPDFALMNGSMIIVPSSFWQAAQGRRVHAFQFGPHGAPNTLFGDFMGQTDWYYLGASASSLTSGIGIQSTGKIIITGTDGGWLNSNANFFVFRFTNDGFPDSTFADSAFVITDFFGNNDYAYDLVMDGDDFIVVGSADSAGQEHMAMVRYNSDGTLDNSFGNNGKAYFSNTTAPSLFTEAAILNNGTVIAGGIEGTNLVLAGVTNAGSTDINEIYSVVPEINIYPNPTVSNTHLEIKLRNSAVVDIYLRDLQGRLIQIIDNDRYIAAGNTTQIIEISSNLSNGCYLLSVESKNFSVSKPLILLRNN